MYNIVNMTLDKVKDGQEVTLYGVYNGKDDAAMPEIIANRIEHTKALTLWVSFLMTKRQRSPPNREFVHNDLRLSFTVGRCS